MNRNGISLYVIFLACCANFSNGAVQGNLPPELVASFKQDAQRDLESARAQMALQRQVDTTREVERIRNLPPYAVLALAQGKASLFDLQFTEAGVLIESEAIPVPASEARGADTSNSRLPFRVFGLGLSVVLLLVGVMTRRPKAEASVTPSRKGEKKFGNLNDFET